MMKRIFLFSLGYLILLTSSCTSDDNNSYNNSNSSNRFPLTIGNYWNYEVENRNINTNDVQLRQDSLFVENADVSGFDLTVNGIAYGTMNSILTQTSVTRNSRRLLCNGSISFPFSGMEDIEIGLTNAILYDINASNNDLLSELTGTNEQIVENIPITSIYTLKTVHQDNFNSIFLNGVSYDNVTLSKIIIELTINTTVEVIPGSFVEVSILDTQNVLEIDNYFAENIGLVRSESSISYQLEDFSQIGITLPFTTNIDARSVQDIINYEVEDE